MSPTGTSVGPTATYAVESIGGGAVGAYGVGGEW